MKPASSWAPVYLHSSPVLATAKTIPRKDSQQLKSGKTRAEKKNVFKSAETVEDSDENFLPLVVLGRGKRVPAVTIQEDAPSDSDDGVDRLDADDSMYTPAGSKKRKRDQGPALKVTHLDSSQRKAAKKSQPLDTSSALPMRPRPKPILRAQVHKADASDQSNAPPTASPPTQATRSAALSPVKEEPGLDCPPMGFPGYGYPYAYPPSYPTNYASKYPQHPPPPFYPHPYGQPVDGQFAHANQGAAGHQPYGYPPYPGPPYPGYRGENQHVSEAASAGSSHHTRPV